MPGSTISHVNTYKMSEGAEMQRDPAGLTFRERVMWSALHDVAYINEPRSGVIAERAVLEALPLLPVGMADQTPTAFDALQREVEELRRDKERYRWRPISELHEDFGPCVLIDINDPGRMEIGSNLESEFDEDEWTHFSQIAPLGHEEAKRLIDAAGDKGRA